jgi:hypothetical protein
VTKWDKTTVVTRSQTAPFASANDGAPQRPGAVLELHAGYASANTPGPSLASPEGREAKAAADEAAAEEQQSLEEVSTPDQ